MDFVPVTILRRLKFMGSPSDKLEFPSDQAPKVIVDSCVWVDILISQRPRHIEACRMYDLLLERGYIPTAPMSLHFEIVSALRHEREKEDAKLDAFANTVRRSNTIEVLCKPIDEAFVARYSQVDLPRLRGDCIYLAMAIVDELPFVTADERAHRVAKQYGVKSYTIPKFLAHLQAFPSTITRS
jgi:predicted nucleic acid-binding protein